jgi:hypothetical protein
MKTLRQILNESVDSDHKRLSDLHKLSRDDTREKNLRWYTGMGAAGMNSRLWTDYKKQPRNSVVSDVGKQIKDVHDITTSYQAPKALTVYSGTKHDPRKSLNSEGIFHHAAFLSTSLNEETAHIFSRHHSTYDNSSGKTIISRHVLKIKVPKGKKCFYVGNSLLKTWNVPQQHLEQALKSHEHELILPDATNLKYSHTKASKLKKSYGDPHSHVQTLTHHMEVV